MTCGRAARCTRLLIEHVHKERRAIVSVLYLNVVRVFENRVLRRTFEPQKEAGEDCIMKSFVTCTLHLMLLEPSSGG